MLRKSNRLSRVKNKAGAKKYSSPLFNISVFHNEGDNIKFGFVVSKKISPKAVVRNRTKRVLQSAAASFLDKLSPGKEVVIVSKKELRFGEQAEVLEEMFSVFKKARII